MNDTTNKGAQQMPHREFVGVTKPESDGGRPVDFLKLAEELIGSLCSDILREICTTGHLAPETYEKVADLSVAHGALAEMIGVQRPGLTVEQIVKAAPQGLKIASCDFYKKINASSQSSEGHSER